MKYLLVGPLPNPINGCSYANMVVLEGAAARHVKFASVNTTGAEISGTHGQRFSLRKAATFMRSYARLPALFNADAVYMTPGQTFFGLLKYAPFIVLALVLRKPYLIHIHGNYLGSEFRRLSGAKKRIFGYLVSRAAAGIALSSSLRSNFDGMLPVEKVFVVENFASAELSAPRGAGKPRDKLRVLFLSNLMREKGVLELLDALLMLSARGVPFEATLAGAMDPEVTEEVDDRLRRLPSARYVGVVTGAAKAEVLWSANVLALPTYYAMEGQPISLLEGLATGNVIVTTNHAGIPDIVDERNGFLVPPRSPEQLALCLERIHESLSDMVDTFSESNTRYAAERFTESRFVEGILRVLKIVRPGARSQA